MYSSLSLYYLGSKKNYSHEQCNSETNNKKAVVIDIINFGTVMFSFLIHA